MFAARAKRRLRADTTGVSKLATERNDRRMPIAPRLLPGAKWCLPRPVGENLGVSFPSDLEIAQAASLRPITEIAAALGLSPDHVETHGRHVAKIELEALAAASSAPRAKYVVVTAITPTPLGEGKTTTSVGLAQAMARIGKKGLLALRQPSMGPTFGIKGGAAGGGHSQVVPMELLNLHLDRKSTRLNSSHT